MTTNLYPLRFKPVYKDYLWGGDKIVRLYRRPEPPGVYAESWEVSDRADGMSVVENGPLAGKDLRELARTSGADLLGTRVRPGPFPLLIKLIDSRERLSVQVHPNDETARAFGGEAKTEMWYVLDAEAGAGVFAGLKPGVDETVFRQALLSKKLEELMNRVPVAPGDAVFIPGGRVHAIDAGCLLLEVQQNSNTTYRIYDWDRVGADGRPRPLHLAEALQVIRWNDRDNPRVVPRPLDPQGADGRWEILRTPYFVLERWVLSAPAAVRGDGGTFEILFVPAGSVTISWRKLSDRLPAGTSCLIPAAVREYALKPSGPKTEVLRITAP